MIQKPPIGIKPEFICIRDRLNDIQTAMDRYIDAGRTIPYSWTEEYIRLLTEKEKAEKRFEENSGREPDMITKEQAAEWFEKMHPPGPAAREMYRMAAEALREPDEPLKNGRSQEHFEKLRNLISDMSVVEIASHIETDNLSEYLGIWRYHAQKELLSIRQLFFEEDNP